MGAAAGLKAFASLFNPSVLSGLVSASPGDQVARNAMVDGGYVASYLGCVAAGGRINTAFSGSGTASLSVATYSATAPISRPRVVHMNWRVNGSTQTEESAANPNTITDWLEYPIGVTLFSPVTGTAPAGGNLVNDLGPANIPEGAQFRVWTYRTGTLQPLTPRGNTSSLSGIITHTGGGASTPVLGGQVPGAAPNFGYFPLVVDDTRRRSALLIGDSHEFGKDDTLGSDSLIGPVERFYGNANAWFNAGAEGDSLGGFLNTGASNRRQALAQYFSDVSLGLAGNDISGGTAAATIISRLNSAAALFPGKKIGTATEFPKTSSTDSWATVANQSVTSNEAARLAVNRFKRSGQLFNYCFDFEAAISEVKGTDIVWSAPGFTSDGTHTLRTTNKAVGAIQGRRFPA